VSAAASNKVRRIGLGALVGLAGLGLAGGAGFLGFVSSLDRVERDPARPADAIVALTGGASRIADAIELLGRGFGRRLLITGVNERTSREEIARLSPGQRRLVECCVDLDYRARNTVGNAEETRRWVRENGFRSLIVVTSNYHMPRTMVELDHALPRVEKLPHPVVTRTGDPAGWWANLATARLLAGEYAKYLAVALRTWFTPPPIGEVLPPRDGPRVSAGDEFAKR
jgi:uncharacterized SAM-binding protein YcdF (DUF218 family)